jgi:hypothetical protein
LPKGSSWLVDKFERTNYSKLFKLGDNTL